MIPRDILAAVSVAVVWGLTFIAIKVGVAETSPLMLSALRFVFAAFPAVLFVGPPKAAPWKVALYGLLLGVGQFGLLFIAIHEGFPVGLASLVVQAQAFFTVALAWLFLSEYPRRTQILGGLVAFAGIAVIGSTRLAGASLGPFLLVVLASFFWGSANVLAKTAGRVDMLAFTVWSSLAAPVPLLALSLAVDGTAAARGARPSDRRACRERAGRGLRRHRVRLRPLGAAPRPLFGRDRRALRPAHAGRRHGRRRRRVRRALKRG